jgi:hypothetical protein
MSWTLSKADQDALSEVDISFYSGLTLNSSTLQFPPKITKDSKGGTFDEQYRGAYEPLPIYKGASSRELGLEFQWVIGGGFVPDEVHHTISQIKEYFYKAFISAGGSKKFPLVTINKLYCIITTRSTWRMHDVNVVYSEELIKVAGKWYPLHVKVTINLKSTTQIGSSSGDKPYAPSGPLAKPDITWY